MRRQTYVRRLMAAAAICALSLACSLLAVPAPTRTIAPTASPSASLPAPSAAPSETSTATAAPTNTATPTATTEATSTPSGPLQGQVLQKANCRYGPGAPYLYKLGMLADAPIEVVGRTADGGWAQIEFRGTHSTCWINSSLIETSGEIMSVPDTYRDSSSLPSGATQYGAATITGISGGGGSVTVDWAPIDLPDYAMVSDIETEYVIEVWTCKNGAPAFYALGTNEESLTFDVDDSCGEPSHADLVVQNKAGVSGVTQIPLP